MISVSGVRGIVGDGLSPEILSRFGEAYGTYVNAGRVVVGRDTRGSGEMVKHALFGGLLAAGCTVLDVGVVTTPTATLMIERLGADGGVVISASHNPIEWNALKFFRRDGIYLNDQDGRDLLTLWGSGDFRRVGHGELKPVRVAADANAHHIERVLEIVDADSIRKKKFRVALDCCNGAGVDVTLKLLDMLGCDVDPIHCVPDGNFPHYPEPNFVNLQDLCSHVARSDVDIGFAQDPDADRIALIDESGSFIGEELSLALTCRYTLQQGARGPVVVNMSTSRVNEDIVREFDCRLERVPVGEVHVAERMKEVGAVFGGEGNGGVMDPRVHCGRDSLVGIVLMLECMARTGKRVSELVGELPVYHLVKRKTDCPRGRAREIIRTLRDEVDADGRANLEDGLRIDWDDAWVHLRGSNTEPVLRVISEARDAERAEALANRYAKRVQDILEA